MGRGRDSEVRSRKQAGVSRGHVGVGMEEGREGGEVEGSGDGEPLIPLPVLGASPWPESSPRSRWDRMLWPQGPNCLVISYLSPSCFGTECTSPSYLRCLLLPLGLTTK